VSASPKRTETNPNIAITHVKQNLDGIVIFLLGAGKKAGGKK
jgi:hypothetical protein